MTLRWLELKQLLWLHPDHQPRMRTVGFIVALLVLGLVVSRLLPSMPVSQMIVGYLPVHTLLEIAAIVIALLVFAVGWNAYRRELSGNILLLACALLGVGLLDVSHVLSYPGMPDYVTPSSPDKAINFWLSARSLAAFALLIIAVRSWRPLASATQRYGLLAAVLCLTAGLHGLFLFRAEWLPGAFIPEQGLTPFKIHYEYALIAINLMTAGVLWTRMRQPLPFNAAGLFGAVCAMALSEYLFTLYTSMTDNYNLLGHIYKVISYLFLYRAVFLEAIELPYNQLRATQNKLQATLDAIPDLLFELDLDGRFHDYHSPRTELLAVPASVFLGRTLREVLTPEVAETGMAALREAHEFGSSRGKQIELVLADGKHWFELSVSRKPVEAGQLPRFVVLSHDITVRRQVRETLRKSKDLLQSIVENAPVRIFWKDRELHFLGCNTLFAQDASLSSPDELIGKTDFDMVWKAQAELYRADDKEVMESGVPLLDFEEPSTTVDGQPIWLSTSKVPLRNADNQIIGILGIYQNITERKQAETLRRGVQQVLEMIAVGAPLADTLETLVRLIEGQAHGMLGSILLLDEDAIHVRHGAAPSLPAAFVAAIDGQPIGPSAGSCGTAAYRKQAVFVEDIASDPLWTDYRALALEHGLRASWSTPILDAQGRVLGTFAMYYRQPGLPQSGHLQLIRTVTHIATIAIIRHREESALRQSETRVRNLIDGLGPEIFVGLMTPDGVLIEVNQPALASASVKPAQVLGTVFENTYWWSYAESAQQQLRAALDRAARGKSTRYETQIRVAENRFIDIDFSLKPLRDETGKVIFLVSSGSVITERKQAEAQLRKLSLAVEQSPDSVVITDLDANAEYVNNTFLKLTGYSQDEVIGKNMRMLQSGKTPRAVYEDMWAHLTRGETWSGELINRRKDGEEYIEAVQISPVRQNDGRLTHYLAIKENITEARKTEALIEKLAHFDQLTGLPNRNQLGDRFKYAHSLALRSGESLAVLFLDLDNFKDVNDSLGHTIGDHLLIEVAMRIKTTLREEDTVSRLGGDEFVLVLHATDADGAAVVAAKLIEAIARPCLLDSHELIITPSIGIAIYPDDGDDFETMSKNADAAMYRVKQGGRNSFCFYTPEMQAHSARMLLLANALRHALVRDELQLYYQPQFSITDGRIIGAEALLRWRHPELGMISPAEFIPIAEDGGQIIPIGEWVLQQATRQMKAWIDSGLPPMVMAVNLSAVQFRQANITTVISHILDEARLPHEFLELELTEAVAMGNPLAAIEVMDKLHGRGIRMSIDDFGTGYSSLSYLKKFKVYKLKIDQSFVRNITDDPEDKAIVSAIINMASSLGIKTIAEGVETAGQLTFLRLQGCDEVQGYYFSKPLPAPEFEAYVRTTLSL